MTSQPLSDVSARTGYIELTEIIISAANRSPNGLVIMCKRHGSPDFYEITDKIFGSHTPSGELVRYHDWDQGFVSNRRDFLTREEAWEVAKNANQIRRVTGKPGTLYSEDLY